MKKMFGLHVGMGTRAGNLQASPVKDQSTTDENKALYIEKYG